MPGARRAGLHLLRLCWAGMVFWQLIWHAMLAEPGGSHNWILAVIAATPLMLLSGAVMKAGDRGLAWGMFLMMIYFIIGVTETWSNAEQRIAAAVQTGLACGFFLGLVLFNRPVRSKPD